MRPYLFHLGPYAVPTHDAFVLLGVSVAFGVFVLEARRRRVLDQRLMTIVAATLVGAALGAKAATVWQYLDATERITVVGILRDGGKSVLGGLAGAYLGAIVTKRIIGYRDHTGDVFAPAVALGLAVGRWGCLLTEQVGTPTSLPWGIAVSQEVASRIPMCPTCAPGAPMHPSFAYEILFHLSAFAVLLWLRPRVRTSGDLFKIFLLGYAGFRFLVEFVRGNDLAWAGLTRPQLFLVPAILVLAGYFVRRARAAPMPVLQAPGSIRRTSLASALDGEGAG